MLAALEQVAGDLLELSAGERVVEVQRTGLVHGDEGRLMTACWAAESSFLAFSAASFRRCKAMGSLRRSTPFSDWNLSAIQSMTR